MTYYGFLLKLLFMRNKKNCWWHLIMIDYFNAFIYENSTDLTLMTNDALSMWKKCIDRMQLLFLQQNFSFLPINMEHEERKKNQLFHFIYQFMIIFCQHYSMRVFAKRLKYANIIIDFFIINFSVSTVLSSSGQQVHMHKYTNLICLQ